jgi:hypothetical protein
MHPARFFLTQLMIIAAEMQNSMDQQAGEFLVQGPSDLSRLSPRRGHGDHHIAQYIRREGYGPALNLPKGVQHAGFPHGKSQHVGCAILTPIPTIETPHPLITHEQDAKLR